MQVALNGSTKENRESLTVPLRMTNNTSDTVRKDKGMERSFSGITPANGKNKGNTVMKHKGKDRDTDSSPANSKNTGYSVWRRKIH